MSALETRGCGGPLRVSRCGRWKPFCCCLCTLGYLVFFQLLQTLRSSSLMDEFRVGELFSKFYGELALKTKIPDTGELYLNVI